MHRNDRLMLCMIAFMQLICIWWVFNLTVKHERAEKAQAAATAAGCTHPTVGVHQLR